MEPGRQRLSQRRKVAALTHGLRTDWQAAERFTDAARAPSARAEGTIRALPPQVRPSVPPARAPSEELTRPRVAARSEATRSGAAEPTRTEHPNSPAVVPARARRWMRFPAAGVLAAVFAGGLASVLFVPSRSDPVPLDAGVTPALTAPVAAIPAPDLGSGSNGNPPAEEPVRAVQPLPAAAPDHPTDAGAPSSATPASKSHDAQSNHPVVVQHKPSAPKVTAPAGTRPTPAEAYDAWSRAAGLDASDQRWKHFHPEHSPHR